MLKRYVAVKAIAGCALLIAGCGGGSDTTPIADHTPTPTPTTYTVGGAVTGLAASTNVVLTSNGANSTPVSSNAPFTFACRQRGPLMR